MESTDLLRAEQMNLSDLKKAADESYRFLQANTMLPPAILLEHINQFMLSLEAYKPIAAQLENQGLPNLSNQLNACLADCNGAKNIYQQMILNQNAVQGKINQIHQDTGKYAFDTIQQVIQQRQDTMDKTFDQYLNR